MLYITAVSANLFIIVVDIVKQHIGKNTKKNVNVYYDILV